MYEYIYIHLYIYSIYIYIYIYTYIYIYIYVCVRVCRIDTKMRLVQSLLRQKFDPSPSHVTY